MGKQDEYIKQVYDADSEEWAPEEIEAVDKEAMRKAELNARRKLEEYRERKAMQEMLEDFDTYNL